MLDETLRFINVLLSAAAAAGLIAAFIRNHDRGLHRTEDPWLIGLMLAAAYGSAEAAVQGAPMGLRVFLWMVGTAGLVLALVGTLRRTGRRP